MRRRISSSDARPPPRTSTGTRAGRLDDAPVVVEVVGRVGLDDVRAQLDGLADERHDRVRVAVDAVAVSPGFIASGSTISGMPERVTARRAGVETLRTHCR